MRCASQSQQKAAFTISAHRFFLIKTSYKYSKEKTLKQEKMNIDGLSASNGSIRHLVVTFFDLLIKL